jgi:hypothetical protein
LYWGPGKKKQDLCLYEILPEDMLPGKLEKGSDKLPVILLVAFM